jgi:hypothetical protein
MTAELVHKEPGDTRKPCDRKCKLGIFGHTDAAKRISDAVNTHFWALGFDSKRKWIAVKLFDGRGGETLYDSKSDAIRHQLDEFVCAYICLTGAPMQVCEAEVILAVHRKAYDAGFRLADPDKLPGGRELISPTALEDRLDVIYALSQKRRR